MGQFIDALRQHVAAPERNSVKTRIADRDVELFAAPLTGADLDRLMKRHPNFASAPTVTATVDLLIAKCQTESGDPAFDIADKPFLLKMPLEWVNSVRAKLFPEQDADLSEDAVDTEVGN